MTTAHADCLAFAERYPTPNVLRGVALAEAGRITWEQLQAVCAGALQAGLDAVSAPRP